MEHRHKAIAQEFAAAERAMQANDMMNVASDPDKRVRQLVDRAQVKARYMAAQTAYDAMIRQMAGVS